ncbi:MAG: FkbM family methyltransferase, partial [Bacteroidota bacterium]
MRILNYFQNNPASEYANETKYLTNAGKLEVFPYNAGNTNSLHDKIEGGFDARKKMAYVLHNGKRLYFPKKFSISSAKNVYLNFIFNMLGERSSEKFAYQFPQKTPHQYITENFFVKEGDIVLDIGGAEGMFLLSVVDKIKKGYIFEPSTFWFDALKATFEPYKEKVILIKKLVSDKDTAKEICVDTCLENDPGNVFIKMDVEGYESLVLKGAKKVLSRKNDIRVACCTYHKHDDAISFEKFFKDLNYETEFSDGYMLFFYD